MPQPEYAALASALVARGFAVLVPQRPGHGKTGGPYLEDQDGCDNAEYNLSARSTGEAIMAAQGDTFDLLLGRRTYDIFAGFWPDQIGPMADSLNAATKYVATHHPDSFAWGPAEDLTADIVEGVRRVKAKDGADLVVWGSSSLTPVLLGAGLADEVLLLVFPVLLGRGKPFFSDVASPRELALVSSKATSSGVLLNTYRTVGPLRTGTIGQADL
ncbi:MAG: dihydrofolate reductase family protein [Gammaproteobacteria bacterium]|nr:dihydrofolate reductase family protein [Gammaproteobacteria bacterium]